MRRRCMATPTPPLPVEHLLLVSSSFAVSCSPGNEFAYGAGSINLESALNPGLVSEESYDHFKEYVNDEREIFELNLPSFATSFSYSRGECKRKFPRKLKDVNVSDGSEVGLHL
ncbi:hypothetical protein POM88_042966 [Heracleum sosnowskyi]|uniref:Uncharacterized protein n=1 Tax=Heracleum sosnowskyi TaxID=360622 RepID=A0AAD8HJV3_9APIA|nr:hypothetical protein POM88_042966 [Heracleum sosnowskyi]